MIEMDTKSNRLRMIIPNNKLTHQESLEFLAKILNSYKEEINLDYDSGELVIINTKNISYK